MTMQETLVKIKQAKVIEPYIITVKYKFTCEDHYTIENQYLDVDFDHYYNDYYPYIWLNDWYEGQEEVEVLGYIKLSEVKTQTK